MLVSKYSYILVNLSPIKGQQITKLCNNSFSTELSISGQNQILSKSLSGPKILDVGPLGLALLYKCSHTFFSVGRGEGCMEEPFLCGQSLSQSGLISGIGGLLCHLDNQL